MNPIRSSLCLLFCLGLAAQDPAPGLLPTESNPPQDVSLHKPAYTSGPLLTRVHFDRPMADGPLWAIGNRWKARFDPTGVQVIPFFGSHAPRNFPLDVTLAGATVGELPLELVAGAPTQVGDEVRTHRGSLTEVVATSLDALEQSWVFDRLPARDTITVDVQMSGDYRVSPIDGGLRFENEHGHVDYQKAVAVDGKGRRLPLPITWLGDRARMQIPASFVAEAELPIVLDPTYNYWFDLGSTAPVGQLQSEPDVSTLQILNGRTLMIWRRQYSLLDQDAWAIMFDGNLGIVRPDFTLDFTSDDWLKIACAGNIQAQNFLVVSEVRIGIQHNIFGRLVDVAGMPQSVLQIEREGVVGMPGNNFHPDVGNEAFAGQSRYTIVWNKKFLAASDIVMKQVTGTGGLVTTNAVPIANSLADEHQPSISKCAGHQPGAERWLVTWQEPFQVLFDMDVHGCFVTWNGAVGARFPIGTTTEFETTPSAGSPIDANGERLWPVVYESRANLSLPRRLICKMMRGDGTVARTFEASNTNPGDKSQAEVDSDGTRVNIAYTVFDGTNLDVEVATFAVLPSSVRNDARQTVHHVFAHQHSEPNLAADVSGGNGTTTRHCLPIRNSTTNTLEMFSWAGFAGSANFFGSTAWGCGPTVPIAAWGAPVIGEQVVVQVAGGSPLAGTMFGFPDPIPVGNPCGCWLAAGVNPILTLGTFTWTVPNNPIYVGIDLTVQGFLFGGNQCLLGLVDLSNSIDFRIR